MPQYVVIADHTPDICPSSNAKVRARAMESMGQQMPKAAQDNGVSFVLEPLHLDPGHRSVAVVEASSIESVTQFVYAVGLSQWNTVEVFPTTPIAELMARVEEFPIVF